MNIKELVKENILLREENEKLKIKLEKYNNSRQSFYEKNKDYVKEKAKERLKKLAEENPENLKQYRRTEISMVRREIRHCIFVYFLVVKSAF